MAQRDKPHGPDEALGITTATRSTIAASANECLELFQECLSQSSTFHARETSIVEGLLARFSTWATSMGVFAPERASMDHRLRYASDVRGVVDGLLESLRYRIRTCSEMLITMGKSMASDPLHIKHEHLDQSFTHIGTEISHLNKISNTIRRSSKETQLQKARDFQIKDDEGQDVEPLVLSIYERHIGDRFPLISENIQQRLARAMVLRRKRILYRRHRQGLDDGIPQISVPTQKSEPAVNTLRKDIHGNVIPIQASALAPSIIQSATTVQPEKFKSASLALSVVSASKTIPLGNHESLVWPSAPGIAIKKRFQKTKIGPESQHQRQEPDATASQGGSKPRGLDQSDFDEIGEITCPYCLHALPAEIVLTERKWIDHVKHDLDPYVCLFEECPDPDVIYSHSNEWRDHVEQHYRFWRCPSHRELGSIFTQEDYVAHVRGTHNMVLSEAQLRTLAKRNARTRLPRLCDLCKQDDDAVEGSLEAHISGHLRSLAVKSLPTYQEQPLDSTGEDEGSMGASTKHSRGTIKNFFEDDVNALGREDLALVGQVKQSNMHNFLGDPYLDLENDPQADWNAGFYERLAYRKLPEEEQRKKDNEMAAAAEAAANAKPETALKAKEEARKAANEAPLRKLLEGEAIQRARNAARAQIEAERKVAEQTELRERLEEEALLEGEAIQRARNAARAQIEAKRKVTGETKIYKTEEKEKEAWENKTSERLEAKASQTDNKAAAAPEDTKAKDKDKPIRFKDAIGRKFSFPFYLCQTWMGMEELIKQAFLHIDVIGPHVQAGHYDLLGPDNEIILPQVWDKVIEPDWAITMVMWPVDKKRPAGPPEMHAMPAHPGVRPPGSNRKIKKPRGIRRRIFPSRGGPSVPSPPDEVRSSSGIMLNRGPLSDSRDSTMPSIPAVHPEEGGVRNGEEKNKDKET